MPVHVQKRALLRQGRVFDLTVETVRFESGFQLEMEIVRHPGAAAVVPIDTDDFVVMLKQYRHAVGQYIWEIPAGTLDADEKPLACAQRELIEETGFRAESWEALGALTPVPSYSDEKIHLFLARQLLPATQKLEQDEILQVHKLPWQEAVRMVLDGRIEDAKTIAGILKVAHRFNAYLQGT
jgi:ADP-ribose pyrophosphatase